MRCSCFHEVGHAIHWLRADRQLRVVRVTGDGEGQTVREGTIESLPLQVRDNPVALVGLEAEVRLHAANYLAGIAAERLFVNRTEALAADYWNRICQRDSFITPGRAVFDWWERNQVRAPEADQDLAIGLHRWLIRPNDPCAVAWNEARAAMATALSELATELGDSAVWAAVEVMAEELEAADSHEVSGKRFTERWHELTASP